MTFLIISIVFVVLYLAARYIKPLGGIIRFVVEVVSQPLSRIEENLEVFQQKPPSGDVKYPGLRTMVILVFLALSLVALSADTYGSLQALTALLGGSVGLPPLPSFFTYSMAALFVSTSAICGGIWLEGLEVLPEEVKIFSLPQDQKKAIQFRLLIGAGFWLSLAATFCYFTLRPFFLVNPNSGTTHALQVLVFVMLSLLVPIVATLSLYLIPVGLQTILVLVARIGLLIVTILRDVCAFLMSHFEDTRQVVNTSAASYSDAPFVPEIVPNDSLALPEQKDMEVSMSEVHASMVSVGFDGTRFLVPIAESSVALGARNVIYSSGVVYRGSSPFRKAWGLGVDITPSHGGIAGSDCEAYKLLFERLEDNQVRVHKPLHSALSPFLYFLDSHLGFIAEDHLRNMSRRLPFSVLAGVMLCSQADLQDAAVQKTISMLARLHTEKVMKTTFVLDPLSDFAITHGEKKLIEFSSRTCISLLLAHTHHPDNLPFTEILARLPAFVTVSFCSEKVEAGNAPARAFWLKWFTKKAVTGDADDMRVQALHATDEVLNNPACLGWSQPVDPNGLVFLVNNFPLRLDDERFTETVSLHTLAVHKKYPQAKLINVRGNGLPYVRESHPLFRVGVAALYPLPDDVFTHSIEQVVNAEPVVRELQTSGALQEPVTDTMSVPAQAVPAARVPHPETIETPPPGTIKKSNGRGRPKKSVKK